MTDKTMTADDVVSRLSSGMTIGIGGWGSRRKPMALVRALLRSEVTDLTVISYGGPDVGLLSAAKPDPETGRGLRHARLDPARTPLQGGPPARRVRTDGGRRGHVHVGLHAAANELPFLPVR